MLSWSATLVAALGLCPPAEAGVIINNPPGLVLYLYTTDFTEARTVASSVWLYPCDGGAPMEHVINAEVDLIDGIEMTLPHTSWCAVEMRYTQPVELWSDGVLEETVYTSTSLLDETSTAAPLRLEGLLSSGVMLEGPLQ